MDTSPEYVKMCDCPEIQGLAKRGDDWQRHDYFYYYPMKREGYTFEEPACVAVIGDAEECGHCLSLYLDRLDTAIWLPTQSQLQEMLVPVYGTEPSLLMDVLAFYQDETSWCKTMEQVWLAIAMATLHSKHWNGEAWDADHR